MAPTPTGDDARWEAIVHRDAAADGVFVYAVKTTGVFCRPSCRSRQPLRRNVELFASNEQAERAGYRACKRCRPIGDDFCGELDAVLTRAC